MNGYQGRIQQHIQQAEVWGKKRADREFTERAITQGWQMGIQMRQMKAQGQQLEHERKKEALNAQYDIFKIRMPFMTDEQIDVETKKLLTTTAEIYGVKMDVSAMEFSGQEKNVANEAIKINEKIQKGGKGGITTRIEINMAYNKLRQDFPRRKLEAITREEGQSAKLLEDMEGRQKAIMDRLGGEWGIAPGQQPTGRPTAAPGAPPSARLPVKPGLSPPTTPLPPESDSAQLGARPAPPPRVAPGTPTPTAETIPYMGKQWKPKPEPYKPTTMYREGAIAGREEADEVIARTAEEEKKFGTIGFSTIKPGKRTTPSEEARRRKLVEGNKVSPLTEKEMPDPKRGDFLYQGRWYKPVVKTKEEALKIGATKELLISKKAAGEKWTESEEKAWELLDTKDRYVAQGVITLLSRDENWKYETDPLKKMQLQREHEAFVKTLFGEPTEGIVTKEAIGKEVMDAATEALKGKKKGKYSYTHKGIKYSVMWDGDRVVQLR